MNFDLCFDRVIGHEKGFQNNPKDRGNWTSGKIGQGVLKGTKYGVSAMSYPNEDIENLTLERAKAIYRVDFWAQAGCEVAPNVLKFDLFDTSVHSGPSQALKFVQLALGVTADGKLGPQTTLSMSNADPYRLFTHFNGHRLDFLNNNPTLFAEFGRGWTQRIADNLINA